MLLSNNDIFQLHKDDKEIFINVDLLINSGDTTDLKSNCTLFIFLFLVRKDLCYVKYRHARNWVAMNQFTALIIAALCVQVSAVTTNKH